MPTRWTQKHERIHLENFPEALKLIGMVQKEQFAKELTVPMDKVGRIIKKSSMKAFKNQWDPATRKPWQPLAQFTLMTRRYPGMPILQQTRALMRSIDYKVVPKQSVTNTIIGTQNKYAIVHQLGNPNNVIRMGEMISPAPIPARPFIGAHPIDRQKIEGTLRRFLKWYTGPTGRRMTRLSTSKLPFKGFR